jgi:hypothetical protein
VTDKLGNLDLSVLRGIQYGFLCHRIEYSFLRFPLPTAYIYIYTDEVHLYDQFHSMLHDCVGVEYLKYDTICKLQISLQTAISKDYFKKML